MQKRLRKKLEARKRRKRSVRKRIIGTAERPRLSVYRSNKHIYVQAIDDYAGHTLAAASSLDDGIEDEELSKVDVARRVGELVAERCKEAGIDNVVFDRNGYPYHSGRVRALAEAAREGGLRF